jgi:hypothetical protein
MDMSGNTNRFDPFSSHRDRPKPDRAETAAPVAAEAAAVRPVEEKPTPTARTGNPFARHADEKKPSIERRLRRALKLEPAQRLLDWLQRDQTITFISARDICNRGPTSIRKLECVIDAARILVEAGWLIPVETRRHDMRWWQVVRKPILCTTLPTVATTP